MPKRGDRAFEAPSPRPKRRAKQIAYNKLSALDWEVEDCDWDSDTYAPSIDKPTKIFTSGKNPITQSPSLQSSEPPKAQLTGRTFPSEIPDLDPPLEVAKSNTPLPEGSSEEAHINSDSILTNPPELRSSVQDHRDTKNGAEQSDTPPTTPVEESLRPLDERNNTPRLVKVIAKLEGNPQADTRLLQQSLFPVEEFWDKISERPIHREFEPVITNLTRPPADQVQGWELKARSKTSGISSKVHILAHISAAHFTRNQAEALCELMTRALNRLPDSTLKSKMKGRGGFADFYLCLTLLNAAIAHLFPEADTTMYARMPQLSLVKEKGKYILSAAQKRYGFHPTTFEFTLVKKYVGRGTFAGCGNRSTPWPETNDKVSFIPAGQEQWPDIVLPSNRTIQPTLMAPSFYTKGNATSSLARHKFTESERYMMLLEEHVIKKSPILTRENCEQMRNAFEMTICSDMRKLQNAKVFTRCSRRARSGFEIRNLKPEFSISIQTFNHDRLAVYAKQVMGVLGTTSDLKTIWRRAAELADDMNTSIAAGSLASTSIDCTGGSHCNDNGHACQGCGRFAPCDSLGRSLLGLMECEFCLEGWGATGDKVSTLIGAKLTAAYRADTTKVLKKLPKSKSNEQTFGFKEEIAEELTLNALQRYTRIEGGILLQHVAYTDKWLRPYPNGDQIRAPCASSVDAVWPFGLHDTGICIIHEPNNVVLTYHCLNAAKGRQLPIYVEYLARYVREQDRLVSRIQHGLTDRQQLDDLQAQLIDNVRRFVKIRRKVPSRVANRMKLMLTPEMVEYLKEEWISGQEHPGSRWEPPPWRFAGNSVFSRGARSWTEEETNRLQTTILTIEAFTGVTLPRSNECPIFVHEASLVGLRWNWVFAYNFVSRQLRTMKNWCNKKWISDNSAETIFLECIFQACLRKMVVSPNDPCENLKRRLQQQYAELLGLPLAMWGHGGLTLSVGHRTHGLQMKSGWPTKPTSVDERLRNDHLNNMIVETWSTNAAKMNHPESTYPDIRNYIQEVRMDSNFVQEDLTPSPCNPELEAEIQQRIQDAGRRSGTSDDESSDIEDDEE